MDYIHSKEIFLLARETLKFIDRRIMDHGSRVAYYVYRMLQCKGVYEPYELADIALLVTFHDIGAYKTDNWDNMLQLEMKDYMPHSVYGYLFFKYLSPVGEMSKAVLYHHMDYNQLKDVDCKYRDVAEFINVAGNADIFFKTMGNRIDYNRLEKQSGTKFSPQAISCLYQAMKKYDLQEKLISGEYKKELDELAGYLIFSNEDKDKYLQMLMYCIGFRSEYSVVDLITGIYVADGIAERMHVSDADRETLRYASMLHDIGMLAIPKSIIDAPRKLTNEEVRVLRRHVELGDRVLNGRMKPEVVSIIDAHHERCDGSGYPKGLKGEDMDRLQKILQLADTITGLTNKRAYREPLSREQVVNIIAQETVKNRYDRKIVMAFIQNYDKIMGRVAEESQAIIATYKKLNQQYLQVRGTTTN